MKLNPFWILTHPHISAFIENLHARSWPQFGGILMQTHLSFSLWVHEQLIVTELPGLRGKAKGRATSG